MSSVDQSKGVGSAGSEFAPLFFSGGTALNQLSQVIKRHTNKSIHLITPFDSGGSSASLREAFAMPAVGDLRNRMLALADTDQPEIKSLSKLLGRRLPNQGSTEEYRESIQSILSLDEPLMRRLESQTAQFVQIALESFVESMPNNFDLTGASLGNLVMCGIYLRNGRNLANATLQFSEITKVAGLVSPTLEDNLQLSAVLQDGREVLGQHLLTGKQVPPISSAISELKLNSGLETGETTSCRISQEVAELIQSADLVCYPPGSFFTSLCANLLPGGVAEAIAANPCNKVYIPNLGYDPEQRDQDINSQIRFILDTLNKQSISFPHQPSSVLTHLLMDTDINRYQGFIDYQMLEENNIELVLKPMVHRHQAFYDADCLYSELVNLNSKR